MSDKPRKRLPIRWLTLAEIVGIVALVIAGLGYWDSHRSTAEQERDRAAATKERQAEQKAGALKQSFVMTGAPTDSGDTVRLTTVHPDQVIQTQTVWFPRDIRADSMETTGNPRLESDWVAGGINKTAGKSKQGRVPVGILTVYFEDGQTKTDRSLYQLGYSRHSRTLRSDRVELEGLSLARRGVTGDLQAAADLWASR